MLDEVNAGAYPAANWPLDIRALLSAISTPAHLSKDRRRHQNRVRFEIDAVLELNDANGRPQKVPVYPRDLCHGGVGFVTSVRLEERKRAVLHFSGRDGMQRRLCGSIRRCRQFA